jgi:ribosomal 50S subunit-associated protein YjgA (DUF615 family)
MSRSDRIAKIIEKRKPLADTITKLEANFSSLDSTLQELETLRNSLLSRSDDANIKIKLQELNFYTLMPKINNELTKLRKLKSRFTRNALNIAVVGRAGQGKSLLLQTLTGLSNKVIPAGSINNCTGVRSVIHHQPGVTTYAEVEFHSERSFLDEMIYPYYDRLKLGIKPITVEQFLNESLPEIGTEVKTNEQGNENQAIYERLKQFKNNLPSYRSLLGKSPLTIQEDEIRKYVSQTDEDGKAVYFQYLAVRQVKINCSFPQSDIGQIALIDLPGLGDTVLGDKELLKKTIGEDVDFVLFVYMPLPQGKRNWQGEDVNLYDIVRSALIELPLEKWSFMLLNQNSGIENTLAACQEAERTMGEKKIFVKEAIIANCAVQEETDKVLDRIISFLENEITSLDKEYLSATNSGRNDVQNLVNSELSKAKTALEKAASGGQGFPLFVKLYNEFLSNFKMGMYNLLAELDQNRDAEDTQFNEKIVEVIKNCNANPPLPLDLDEAIAYIKKIMIERGGFPQAFFYVMEKLRTDISEQFLNLDNSLMVAVEQAKSNVTNVLVEQCKLGGLSSARDTEFLKVMLEKISQDSNLTQLKKGFQFIVDFEISYRGLVAHRIRKYLDYLTPNKKPQLPFDQTLSQNEIIENIHHQLHLYYRATLADCKKALEGFNTEPNQAAYGMVEAFYDQVLRYEGIEDEWIIFLEQMRAEVWPEEFDVSGEKTQNHVNWSNLIEKAFNYNQLNL